MKAKPPAAWSRPADLKAHLQKRWDQGVFVSALVRGELETVFPYRLPCASPGSRELADHFDAVRDWIADLQSEPRLRIEWRSFVHRVLGNNRVPDSLWVDSVEDVAAWLGCGRDLDAVQAVCDQTRRECPELLDWLCKKPSHAMQALRLHKDWPRLLRVVTCLKTHPRPGMYLRQLDLPGIHTKFIERHQKILVSLLDHALPGTAIDTGATGGARFLRRYGFREKPERVRFRFLDPEKAPMSGKLGRDMQIDADAFAELCPEVSQVFITENEINFLAFPDVADSLILFGSGYGFESVKRAAWLRRCRLRYWGDLDTHGFAILDQLRAAFPSAESLCMDLETLLAFKDFWGREPGPTRKELTRLTPSEMDAYNALRSNHYGENLRLEQEHIQLSWLNAGLGCGKWLTT